jgi:hypothetical protein
MKGSHHRRVIFWIPESPLDRRSRHGLGTGNCISVLGPSVLGPPPSQPHRRGRLVV